MSTADGVQASEIRHRLVIGDTISIRTSTFPPTSMCRLYRRRVQHDPDRSAKGLWRQVVLELCSDYTRVSCITSVSRSKTRLAFDDTHRVAV